MRKLFSISNNKRSFFLFILMFSSLTSYSQVRFYATTDAKEIFQGSYFKINFTIKNGTEKKFTPPDFKGFRKISGPNSSFYSSSDFVNGVMSTSTTKIFSYTLLAKDQGTFTIGPAKAIIKNKVYKTNPLTIKVLKKEREKPKTQKENKDIFAKIELSDSVVYIGQQIILKYNLYTTKNIASYDFKSIPDFNGFNTIELNNKSQGIRKIIGDKEYYLFTIKKIALFPQKTGKLIIDPAYINLKLPSNNSRNFFFRSIINHKIHTNSGSILVKPLPDNAPDDFSGYTGKFNISIKTDRKKVSTDDAFTLKLQLTSDNLAKYIEAPDLSKHLTDFEIYDPKVIGQKYFEQNGKLQSKKIFEYLLVPQKPGSYMIQIPFTYFDIDSSKYLTIYSNPVTIGIIKGSKKINSKSILEKYQLKPPLVDNSLSKIRTPFFGSFSFWLILGIMLIVLVLMYLYRRYLLKQSNIDPVLLKRKKAGKEAIKRLKKAKEYMENNQQSLFYKEISDALLKYIADKLNIPTIELTKENVKSKLQNLNISENNIQKYISLLETCEIALYSPGTKSDMHSVFDNTKKLLTEMELQL